MADSDLKKRISIHIFGEDEFTAHIFELISVIQSFQLPIKIDNESDEKPSYNFEVVRDDTGVPFSTNTENSRKAIINANYYNQYKIKVPFVNYLLYSIAHALFELELKNKLSKQNISLYENYKGDSFISELFYGRYHRIVNGYLVDLSEVSISQQLSEKVTNQLQYYYQEIHSRYDKIITYLGEEGIYDTIVTTNLLDIFSQTKKEEIDSTLQAFDAHDKNKWYSLINLIAQSSNRRKMEILNYFLYQSKIDISIKAHFEYLLFIGSNTKKDWKVITNFLLKEYDTKLSEEATKIVIEIVLEKNYIETEFSELLEELEIIDENALENLLKFLNSSKHSKLKLLLKEIKLDNKKTPFKTEEPIKQEVNEPVIRQCVDNLINFHKKTKKGISESNKEKAVKYFLGIKDIFTLISIIHNPETEEELYQAYIDGIKKIESDNFQNVIDEFQREAEKAEIGRTPFTSENSHPVDALSYKKYAEALASVIADKNTWTPLTIGICAPWGMGKTVLMNFIEDEIVDIREKIKTKKEKLESSKLQCDVIKINAWEISKAGTIWEEFYVQVLTKFEVNLGKFKKFIFRYKLLRNSSKVKTIFYFFVFPLLSIGLILSLIIYDYSIFTSLEIAKFKETKYISTILDIFAFITPLALSLWKLIKSFWNDFMKRISKQKNSNNSNELETLNNINSVKKTLEKLKINRTIILVDDLDRCDYKNILNILESMQLFLRIDKFVFILGLDTRVVRHAVGQHYKFMCNDNGNNHEQENMGRFYLEKIIQIPFHLPSLSAEQKKELNKHILQDYTDISKIKFNSTLIVAEPIEAPTDTSDKPPNDTSNIPPTDTSGKAPIDTSNNTLSETPTEQKKEIFAKITTQEAQWIIDLSDNDLFDISPRLVKRFLNIYLIARHMYISEYDKHPDYSFIYWLALSVNYPYETKALLEWMEGHDWHNPMDNLIDLLSGLVKEQYRKELNYKNNDFSYFDKLTLLYFQLHLDHNEIRKTVHITNCFNLILD